jgi:hypothetical protein
VPRGNVPRTGPEGAGGADGVGAQHLDGTGAQVAGELGGDLQGEPRTGRISCLASVPRLPASVIGWLASYPEGSQPSVMEISQMSSTAVTKGGQGYGFAN